MSTEPAREGRPATLSLLVRRTVAAPPDAVFRAWTEVESLKRWWGPPGITCTAAEVDLRVGGRYRLANENPDGAVLWITGMFEAIERPRRLVYSWAHEPVEESTDYTRVTVRFDAVEAGTDVTLVRELLPSEDSRITHRDGWNGCLSGLEALFAS